MSFASLAAVTGTIAVFISLLGLLQQRFAARRAAQQRLDDVISKLQTAIDEVFYPSKSVDATEHVGGSDMSADQFHSYKQISLLSATADELYHQEGAEPGWLGLKTLAQAFNAVYDTERADEYWNDLTERMSRGDQERHSIARHDVLVERAAFRYQNGRPTDLDGARQDFTEAVSVLELSKVAPEPATELCVMDLAQQAKFESNAGHDEEAQKCLDSAAERLSSLKTTWRRERAARYIGNQRASFRSAY